MFLFEVVALRSRLSQAKLCASAQYFSMGGNPMSTNDTFAWYIDAFATFSMSAKLRSALYNLLSQLGELLLDTEVEILANASHDCTFGTKLILEYWCNRV